MARSSEEIAIGTEVELMRKDLAERGLLAVQSGSEVADMISERILSAETIADVFKSQTMQKSDDWIGAVIEVTDVRWNESTIEESAGIYAVVTATDTKTGEQIMFTTGARQVIAQLYKCDKQGWLPVTVRLCEAQKPSKAGYRAQWLELVR